MEIDLFTVVAQVVNFLVLVWILKRFLYKPVLGVIARRREGIEKSLAEAEKMRTEAHKLEQEYQGRLTEWEKERQKAREDLAREIDAERNRRLEALKTELAQEKEKVRVSEMQRQADMMHRNEETALRQGARFAARLLELGCGPETETRLVEMALEGLTTLSREGLAQLRTNFDKTSGCVIVSSAFPLTDGQRQQLKQTLEKILESDLEIQFEEDRELLAGLCLVMGNRSIGLNLRDELEGFRILNHHDDQ